MLRQLLGKTRQSQMNDPLVEACVGAHHLSRQLLALGHDVKLVPGQFVKPFLKGQKNDFRDAEAVAEAAPTMPNIALQRLQKLTPLPSTLRKVLGNQVARSPTVAAGRAPLSRLG
jgi:transposase